MHVLFGERPVVTAVGGFGAGFCVAVAWNSLNLFVTHFMQSGALLIWNFLRTGELEKMVEVRRRGDSGTRLYGTDHWRGQAALRRTLPAHEASVQFR